MKTFLTLLAIIFLACPTSHAASDKTSNGIPDFNSNGKKFECSVKPDPPIEGLAAEFQFKHGVTNDHKEISLQFKRDNGNGANGDESNTDGIIIFTCTDAGPSFSSREFYSNHSQLCQGDTTVITLLSASMENSGLYNFAVTGKGFCTVSMTVTRGDPHVQALLRELNDLKEKVKSLKIDLMNMQSIFKSDVQTCERNAEDRIRILELAVYRHDYTLEELKKKSK